MDPAALRRFYISQIEDDFMPYWQKFVDEEQGGILNCINNQGDELLSHNKFTWSQGRWLWVLGRLHDLSKQGLFPKLSQQTLERWMAGTYRFLTEKSIGEDQVCCYLLTRSGERLVDERTGRYDASIYADCFALIGMAQYVKTMGLLSEAGRVEALYKSIVRRIEANDFLTEPYPIPEGYRIHGIPMILTNTVQEYILMRQRLGLDASEEIAYARGKADFILDTLADGRGHIREFVLDAPGAETRMLDRHINPGHTLEDAWFLLEFYGAFGGLKERLEQISRIAKTTFALGWDTGQCGLLGFVDIEGGRPRGESRHSAYEDLMEDTWDMKLWWPHSEILYLFPLLYKLTGDPAMDAIYRCCHSYVFNTFPNRELGEWTQIRRRDGTPEQKLVALPVKDPFHILRDYIKLVELTAGWDR